MFSAIIYFCALILILCGLAFVFYLLTAKVFCEGEHAYFIALEGFEEDESLSYEIYCALSQVNMMNFGKKRPVYVIDRNLSEKRKAELAEENEAFGKIVFLKGELKETNFIAK